MGALKVVHELTRHDARMPDRPAATWKPVKLVDGRYTASVTCPTCRLPATLENHRIDAHGNVSPSLICPFDCGFHAHVRLLGWPPIESGESGA